VASVLHLGELAVDGDEDGSSITTIDELKFVSQLIGCTEDKVEQAFTMQSKTAGREKIMSPLSKTKALGCRDALARALYSKLFDWLVSRINKKIGHKNLDGKQICVLDIFGFENFQHNSYEQLCINYANEKLQQKFTADVFKTVQEEYKMEGVSWDHVDFADNETLLMLLEGRMGIISLLNEECMRGTGTGKGQLVSKQGSKEAWL
jgi:myosin-5